MWNLKTKVMPVTGATRTISKYKMFITRNSITRGIKCNHRIAVTLCAVRNEREENVVNQHNLFRKMLYPNQVVLIDYTFLPLISYTHNGDDKP